jgi:FkbM family methyltransferase
LCKFKKRERRGGYKKFFYAKYQNVLSYSNGISERGLNLGDDYLLKNIEFNRGDLVIDCGANVGDFKIYFENLGLDVNYVGIEPSPSEYFCLVKNTSPCLTFNLGLWNKNSKLKFYISSRAGDSSFLRPVEFSSTEEVLVVRLDKFFAKNFKNKRIKLLKVEAEGAEPEVIYGCKGILDKIEYISADCGFERGQLKESTVTPVTNFLCANGFEVVDISYPRLVVLFKNKNYKN